MRDPKRIDAVLDAILEVWIEHPDMRLGQLIVNAIQPAQPNTETFGTEDFRLIKKLHQLRERLASSTDEISEDSCSIESLNEITGNTVRHGICAFWLGQLDQL